MLTMRVIRSVSRVKDDNLRKIFLPRLDWDNCRQSIFTELHFKELTRIEEVPIHLLMTRRCGLVFLCWFYSNPNANLLGRGRAPDFVLNSFCGFFYLLFTHRKPSSLCSLLRALFIHLIMALLTFIGVARHSSARCEAWDSPRVMPFEWNHILKVVTVEGKKNLREEQKTSYKIRAEDGKVNDMKAPANCFSFSLQSAFLLSLSAFYSCSF